MDDWSDHELVDVLGDGRWLLDPQAMELRPAWEEAQDLNWRWKVQRLNSASAVLNEVTTVLGYPSRTPIGDEDDQLLAGLLRCLHLILDLDWVGLHQPVPAEAIEDKVHGFARSHGRR